MTLREILVERRAALCGRWLDAILDDYDPQTAARWRRTSDPFANPIGHVLGTALPVLLEAVAGEGEPAADAVRALEEVVRIRCVQELAPSRAVRFVYALRDAIREELAAELTGRADELRTLEGRVERLAFLAFDTHARCREQIFRLRQDELKRSVASLLRRWHGDEIPEPPPDVVRLAPPPKASAAR